MPKRVSKSQWKHDLNCQVEWKKAFYKATIKSKKVNISKKLRNTNSKNNPLKKDIFLAYTTVPHDLSYGVRIDDLWKAFVRKKPEISFKDFEKQLLELIHTYIGDVVPSEGISEEEQKIIYDPKMPGGMYFHYIKFSPKIIHSILLIDEPEENRNGKETRYSLFSN